MRFLPVTGSALLFISMHCTHLDHSREVKARQRLASRLGLLEIAPHLAEEGQAGEDANLLFGLLVKAVLLWANEIEEGLGPTVQVVQSLKRISVISQVWMKLTPVLVLHSRL
jgi:hypothetical protein